jgi:hypothetical protein
VTEGIPVEGRPLRINQLSLGMRVGEVDRLFLQEVA